MTHLVGLYCLIKICRCYRGGETAFIYVIFKIIDSDECVKKNG